MFFVKSVNTWIYMFAWYIIVLVLLCGVGWCQGGDQGDRVQTGFLPKVGGATAVTDSWAWRRLVPWTVGELGKQWHVSAALLSTSAR